MENHDEAYGVWCGEGFQEKILVHIDAHDDLAWAPDAGSLNIGNFISLALKEGIIREIFWVVPDQTWKTSGTRKPLRRRLKKLMAEFPGASRLLKVEEAQISLTLLDKPVRVCTLDHLPKLPEKVLLDIDTDFFTISRACSTQRSASHLAVVLARGTGVSPEGQEFAGGPDYHCLFRGRRVHAAKMEIPGRRVVPASEALTGRRPCPEGPGVNPGGGPDGSAGRPELGRKTVPASPGTSPGRGGPPLPPGAPVYPDGAAGVRPRNFTGWPWALILPTGLHTIAAATGIILTGGCGRRRQSIAAP